jgi:hypothetical protein
MATSRTCGAFLDIVKLLTVSSMRQDLACGTSKTSLAILDARCTLFRSFRSSTWILIIVPFRSLVDLPFVLFVLSIACLFALLRS